jgi:hypothetical protein
MRPAKPHCNNSRIIRQSLCGRSQFRLPQQYSRDEGVLVAAAVSGDFRDAAGTVVRKNYWD